DDALGPLGPVRAGSIVSLRDVAASSSSMTVETPSGKKLEVPFDPTTHRALVAADEVGVHRARVGGREVLFAASVLAERETDVTPRPALELGRRRIAPRAGPTEGRSEIPVPFALAALALLLIEGFAYHRRL